MPELIIRGELKYDTFLGPMFSRFLPLRDAAQWRPLGITSFAVRVYTDPKRHRGWITDLDLDQIDRCRDIRVTGIFIELRATVDDPVAEAIAGDQRAGEYAHDFVAEVLEAFRKVHSVFVAVVRHENLQYWIAPWEDHHYSEAVDQRLAWYDARWQMPDGAWGVLHSQCPRCQIPIDVTLGDDTVSLRREAWDALEKALERGGCRARPHRRLLANAFAQYDRRELRAAIVEAVATWEMGFHTLVPARLAEHHSALNESAWKAALKELGLRAGTEFVASFLPELRREAEALCKAIECRNNVIHNWAFNLDPEKIKGWLLSIARAIDACDRSAA